MNTSNTFSVGELVFMQNASYHNEFDGALAVVICGLAERASVDSWTLQRLMVNGYRVKVLVESEEIFCALPHQLRPLSDTPSGALEDSIPTNFPESNPFRESSKA